MRNRAAYYLEQAKQVREQAAAARDPDARQAWQLDLAKQYEELAAIAAGTST